MSFLKVNQIDKVWANICKYEGDVFYTKNHLQYTYIVKDNYVIINIPSKTKITKNYFEKALEVNNPTPTKIMDGRIIGDNLSRSGKDEKWLREQLKLQGYKDSKEIFLALYRPEEEKLTLYPNE